MPNWLWDRIKGAPDRWRDRFDKAGDYLNQKPGAEVTPEMYTATGGAERAEEMLGIGRQGFGQSQQARSQQQGLADMLRRRAMGRDSLSAEQLRQGMQSAVASQQSLAASARPGQSAMMARLASQNTGRLQQGLAGQQALAGIQERSAAEQGLAGVLGGMRQQDIGTGQFGMGSEQQQALAELGVKGSLYGQQMGAPTRRDGLIGALGGAIGVAGQMSGGDPNAKLGLASDKKLKEAVTIGGDKADALMEALKPKEYRYKSSPEEDRLWFNRGVEEAGTRGGEPDARLDIIPGSPPHAAAYSSGRDMGLRNLPRMRREEAVPPMLRRYDGWFEGSPEDPRASGDHQVSGAARAYWRRQDDKARRQVPDKNLGVMAQDIERSPVGRQVVKNTPSGKMLDVPQLTGALAAAIGRLNERLRSVEGR